MKSLNGQIAFITGASSGVGKACAEQLAAQGAHVIVTARRLNRLTALVKDLESQYGVKALPLHLDVSNKNQVKEVISSLDDNWKNIDILVNNAGVGVTSDLMQNADPDDWDVIIDTNVKGLLYVTRAIVPNMVKRNSGHIVNIGSAAAHDYAIGWSVYCASKHAVKALTRSLRLDLKGYQIKVSEVDPGMIQTEFSEARWGKKKADAFYQGFEPLVGDDVADAVLYCVTRPKNVNISEIMVYATANVAPTIVHRKGDPIGGMFEE